MVRDAALAQARALRALLNPPPVDLAPPDLFHAYATQVARLIRLGDTRAAAFRLGGTNALTRAQFSTEAPYFGMFGASEVINTGALGFAEAVAPMVEPQFAIASNRTLPPRLNGYGVDELAEAIAWVAPALDITDTAFADPQAAGLKWVIADRGGAGRLVLGERMGADALDGFENAWVMLEYDREPVSMGTGEAIIGGALGALREFLLVLGRLGVELPAGTPVSLGGCTPPERLPDRGHVTALFGDVGSVKIAV